MKTLLLIDGTNFFFRGNWGTGGYPNKNGHDMTYLYAFIRNFCSLVRQFEKDGAEVKVVVCWDGGHEERTELSRAAVARGIVPKEYKQTRRESHAQQTPEQKRDSEDFKYCLQKGQELLLHTRFSQSVVSGVEADDVVGSWCKQSLGQYDDIVVVTSDRDYYQLLFDGVRIYNPMRKEWLDKSVLARDYGLSDAHQWVEVGALAGDDGDTIYGVPGIGTKTAARLIAQYGSIQGIYEFAEKRWAEQLRGGTATFTASVRDGSLKPSPMKEAKVLAYREVVELALKLKAMYLNLVLPETKGVPDWRALEALEMSEGVRIPQNCMDVLMTRK